jgi:tetratricopeptide (TPR) repeat protein
MTRIMKYLFYTLTIYCCQLTLLAQQNKIDSLLILLKTTKEDTAKVKIFNNLFLEYEFSDDEKAKKYLNEALDLSLKKKFKKELANTYILFGYFAEDKGEYAEALNYYFSSLKIRKVIGDKKGVAESYNNRGNVYSKLGSFSEALNNYFACLKISQEIGDQNVIATSLNNIGNIYLYQGNYVEALENYFACLKISESRGYKMYIASAYRNIGNVYINQGKFIEAVEYHFASLKISEAIADKPNIAVSYNNIGNIYFVQGNYPEALKYYTNALKIKQDIGEKKGIALSYHGIGNVYFSQGNLQEALKKHIASIKISEDIGDIEGLSNSYLSIGTIYTKLARNREAEEYLYKSIQLAKEIGVKESLKESFHLLSEIDSAKLDFKGAYENHKLYILYRDSIDNEETRKKTVQSQMTYDFEKKEAATQSEQDKKDVIANEELKQKEQQRNYFVIGFALVGLLAIFILRGYKQKQKANFIITQQKGEVEKSKHIIEEKNKDITDSINYAKRIQRATLPHRKDIWAAFPQSFVLFKPKDIVSGDFYFFNRNNNSAFIAAADCTGHGVPGAFMSMIGAGKLNDAVSESSDTSEILSLLNKGIKYSLKQTDGQESTRDGMDIVICSVDTESRIIKYAGANRPLWIIRNGQIEVEEIKATKCAIGGLTNNNQHFETHEFKLLTGDTLYLFTDGFADQFGGGEGKKLMTKKFKEILLDIQGKSMKEQEQYLNNFIDNWKAGTEQVDDILVIGIRL